MRQITIQYHCEGGHWWAESPDLPGFSAAAPDYNLLRSRALMAIREIVDTPFTPIELGRVVRDVQAPADTDTDLRVNQRKAVFA